MKEQNALPKLARDQLAREQRAGAAVHPDADVLTAFCEGALNDAERSRVMEHISRCGECREVVFLAAPETVVVAVPAVAPVVSRWRRFVPVIAAVAAVVVVGSAVVLNRTTSYRTESAKLPEMQAKIEAPVASPDRARTAEPAAGLVKQESPPPSVVVNGKAGKAEQIELPDISGAQNQVTASGPHGALAAKGNSSNYQNLAVTPAPASRAARVAPGPHGEVEAKGNAYFMENAAPQLRKDEGAVSGAASEASAPSTTSRDQVARRELNVPTTGRSVGALVTQPEAAPEKAKAAQKPASTAPAATNETVEVTAQAAAVDVDNVQTKKTDAFSNDVSANSKAAVMASSLQRPSSHWRITDAGGLQRSFGNGQWSAVLGDGRTKFRVVAVLGNEVWAGGSEGALYHSRDSGEHWAKVPIEGVTETITSIHFSDASSGMVATDGATWQTSDGGVHWMRK